MGECQRAGAQDGSVRPADQPQLLAVDEPFIDKLLDAGEHVLDFELVVAPFDRLAECEPVIRAAVVVDHQNECTPLRIRVGR